MQRRGGKTRTDDPVDASHRAQSYKIRDKKSPGCRLVSGVLITLEGELTTFIKENKEMESILLNPHEAAQHLQYCLIFLPSVR